MFATVSNSKSHSSSSPHVLKSMSTTPPTATIPVASTSSRTTRGRSASLYNSPEFKAAFLAASSSSFPVRIPAPSHHSRSYSASTNMNLGLSSSPTSTSSTSSIATPPSTSPTTIFASYYGIPVKGGGGKDEEDETEDVFARGDRWGWPQPSQAQNHQRRASLGPSGTGLIGLPLGRVASAGASFGGPSPPAAGDGWGLFRRLSHGGFSGRVSLGGLLSSCGLEC